MSIHPQRTHEKNENAFGFFCSVGECEEVSSELQIDLPQWQKDALDVELKAFKEGSAKLTGWDDVKKQFIG
jgi:hypothetical protein